MALGGAVTLYLMKPVVWNREGYVRPSGVKVHSGHPRDYGFGYEEWNNSPRLTAELGGRRLRYFHTEGFKNTPLDEHQGDFVVFMYASHDNRQELVGVAGQCVMLNGQERKHAAGMLGLASLAEDVWSLPSARKLYSGEKAFRDYWKKTLQWMPAWRAPDERFFWPDEPVVLDATQITGKGKLTPRFSGFTGIDERQARRVMEFVPQAARTTPWRNLYRSMQGDEGVASQGEAQGDALMADLETIRGDLAVDATTRRQLVDARIGQGGYRRKLERRWKQRCAVTGCDVPQALRASHIKPWRRSSNAERLDPANGLLLVATLDALFDRHLISFNEQGEMLVSGRLSDGQKKALGVPRPLSRKPDAKEGSYLAEHRRSGGFD